MRRSSVIFLNMRKILFYFLSLRFQYRRHQNVGSYWHITESTLRVYRSLPQTNLKGEVTALLIVIVVDLVGLKLPQQSKTLQQTVALLFIDKIDSRDVICKLFRSPKIDSKESIPPADAAWRASTTTLFLLGSQPLLIVLQFQHTSVVTLMEYDRLHPENYYLGYLYFLQNQAIIDYTSNFEPLYWNISKVKNKLFNVGMGLLCSKISLINDNY